MKKFFVKITTVFLIFALFLPLIFSIEASAEGSYEVIYTEAKACVVIDKKTGRILGGHNIEDKLPMASTTKIMTALLTLEAGNLDEWFVVDSEAIKVEGSSMGLVEGDEVTLRALLYGMMLPSGNDAANAAAVKVGGTIEDFVYKMNKKAEELGLENTQFKNPSGLDADGHFSTALDMAKLCAAAMEYEEFREICCLTKAQVEFGNPPYKRWLENYNKLLTLYPYAIGVKTGFTENAYRCLVSAAEKDGNELICVTLNCANDWETHKNLYEKYFSQIKKTSISDFIPKNLDIANSAVVKNGEKITQISLKSTDEDIILLPRDILSCEIFSQPLIFAPVYKNDVVGEAVFYLNGEEYFRKALISEEDILCSDKEKRFSLIDRLCNFIIQLFW